MFYIYYIIMAAVV